VPKKADLPYPVHPSPAKKAQVISKKRWVGNSPATNITLIIARTTSVNLPSHENMAELTTAL